MTGPAGRGSRILKLSRVESDQVGSEFHGAGLIGSGGFQLLWVGSGCVGSGRVGSGRVGPGRVGSGRVGSS